jgi:serine/threonine protein kinase
LEPHVRRTGATLGRWRLVEPLAKGGTAEVWRAIDADGREVALKLSRGSAAELLRAEYALLASLGHPAFVRPIEFVVAETRPVALALELLPGGDLVPLLGAPPRHWLPALRAVLAAVRYLHDRGFAHRDLKARNVLFAADGAPRVIDLASACAVDAPGGMPAGATAAHLPADPAITAGEADRFALAVLVYELVTGRLPFGVNGARELGARPAPAAANDAVGARLAAVASDILVTNGRAAWGLSALADVIESAAAHTVESER